MSRRDLADIARAFRATGLPAVSLEGACGGDLLLALRACADGALFDAFELAHRGRYTISRDAIPDGALDELASIARACAGAEVHPVIHRWIRLRRGDYALSGDEVGWAAALAPRGVHLVVDLSTAATGEAEAVFTHRGQAYFTMPQRPGELALVERGPTVSRYDRYLTHRVGEVVVTRLEIGFSARAD